MVKDRLLFFILDLLGTESTSTTIPDTLATEFTGTTKAWPSFLMSFPGDLVPYFHTTGSEEEIDDKTVGDSAATLLDGDGGEIEPRETGSQAGGEIYPQIRRRLGYAADGHRIRWVKEAQVDTGRTVSFYQGPPAMYLVYIVTKLNQFTLRGL